MPKILNTPFLHIRRDERCVRFELRQISDNCIHAYETTYPIRAIDGMTIEGRRHMLVTILTTLERALKNGLRQEQD